jgi:hypothetical protein
MAPVLQAVRRLWELERPVAKVVDTDGSMVKFEGHSCACFLCSTDELGFDAPARALAAEEPLQPALPASTLRQPM